ncbi:ankyrin repeat domain-containing protein 26-like isoform X2 [Cervus canadensis]|uniref:ankyrin repeat domain-containing protein 26-like isoform X2 n=1 Tax=Cervus canadensis TaxID=1574408 RepID=UPI001C9E5BF7|nr:ankyrin repeat domain-containing protein 26-like isoform X2 [Cervus canadensis]
MNRTALHLACANGHLAVVALLLERRCQLNLRDSENRTALMKAVECQEEKCATLLLEHGADPNLTDANGNTALHHAVFCQNISLAAKLLSYDANIEARNEDDLTPLLLAISERKQQMVEFLVKKEANVHAVDKMKRTALILAVSYESMGVVSLLLQRGADVSSQDVFGRTAEEYAALSGFNTICQLISEYKEKRPKTPPEKSNPVDTRSEEDSLSRFSNKPGADSWPPSDDEVLDFETKHVPKPNLAKLLKAFLQSKRNEAECGIVRWDSPTSSEDSNSDSEIEDVLETFPKPSPGVQGFPHPAFPRPDPLPTPLKTLAGLGLAQTDHLPAELGAACSQCLHLDATYQVLQRELLSMKGWQRKCEKLEKENKKLEQEVVKLKSPMELKMIEHPQVEQYKREIEERVRQDLVEKWKEVNLFLQTRAACQEISEQFQEGHIASVRSQMELRIKDLESELSRTETLQDYKKAEMEKYKKLYLEELKVRKSLEKKLDMNNERLAEMSTELEVEKQQKKSYSALSAAGDVAFTCFSGAGGG